MLRFIWFRTPNQSHCRVPFRKHILFKDPDGMCQSRRIRPLFFWPRTKSVNQRLIEISRQRKRWMNSRPARIFGCRIMQICVPAGTYTNRNILFFLVIQDFSQSGSQEHWDTSHCNLVQFWFHGTHRIIGVKFPDQKPVSRQAMSSGIHTGDHAGTVDTGNGRKHGVVVGESYSGSCEI